MTKACTLYADYLHAGTGHQRETFGVVPDGIADKLVDLINQMVETLPVPATSPIQHVRFGSSVTDADILGSEDTYIGVLERAFKWYYAASQATSP